MAEQEFTTEELESEDWKPCPGFETDYSVSSLGRIRRDTPQSGTRAGRILRPYPNNHGYWVVTLRRRPLRWQIGVHQLVTIAFHGPRPDGQTPNHEDGVKANNRASNLTWMTDKEQKQHASRLGLLATGERHRSRTHPESLPRGEANGLAKLTDAKVLHILALGKQGRSQRSIAAEMGVTQPLISLIWRGEIWKHIPR